MYADKSVAIKSLEAQTGKSISPEGMMRWIFYG